MEWEGRADERERCTECSMKEDEIANDGHLSFCRMILEQLKTSGGDSFVLQSIRFVYVCCVCALVKAATNDLIC